MRPGLTLPRPIARTYPPAAAYRTQCCELIQAQRAAPQLPAPNWGGTPALVQRCPAKASLRKASLRIRGLAGPRPGALQLGPPPVVVRFAPSWAIRGLLCHGLENPWWFSAMPLSGRAASHHNNNSWQLLAPLRARHWPPCGLGIGPLVG